MYTVQINSYKTFHETPQPAAAIYAFVGSGSLADSLNVAALALAAGRTASPLDGLLRGASEGGFRVEEPQFEVFLPALQHVRPVFVPVAATA